MTYYRVVDEREGLTLCECLLGTGRTHQIRAQFAATGHPLLGDNQYGSAELARRYGHLSGQALYAYRLIFRFETTPDALRPSTTPVAGRGCAVCPHVFPGCGHPVTRGAGRLEGGIP